MSGGGGGGARMSCCCNNGYMYDGRDCVACAAGYNDTQATLLTYNHSCEDNRAINGSSSWLSCAHHQHKCSEPVWCCCDRGFQWTDKSGCAPCANDTCVDNLPIQGSEYWWSCSEAHYHRCSYPMSDSGASNKYCCCKPFTQWDPLQKSCVPSVVPVTPSVIPDSDHYWLCDESQYACNPYSTALSDYNDAWRALDVVGTLALRCFSVFIFASIFVFMLFGFCLTLMMIGCCGASAQSFSLRVVKRASNEEAKRKAKECLAHRHPLIHMTCATMVSRDSSYHQSWICDHCDRRHGASTPFVRCEECGLDFCQSCCTAAT